MKRFAQALLGVVLVFAVLSCVAVASAAEAKADEAKADKAVTVMVPQNNYQAYAFGLQAAQQSRADQCESKAGALKAMAAKCSTDICLALFADKVERACGEPVGGQQAAVLPPLQEKPWYVEVKDTLLDAARVALPFVDRVMTSRDNRAARESAERQNVALYGTFRDINGQTANLGVAGFGALERTATGGFGAIERTAAAAFKNPTYSFTFTGNDNNLFGSTSTRTYVVQCQGGNGAGGGASNAPGGGGGQAPCEISK